MKKFSLTVMAVMAGATLLLATVDQAAAAVKTSDKDVNKLTAQITMLNAEAKLPQADQVIMKQLKDTFNVGSDKISSLLGKNMQYGDIATVLAFADKMPGGITDANINQVLSLHQQSPTGWSQVAKNVNVDVSSVASKLSTMEDSAHKDIKEALAKMPAGSAAGGVSQPGESMGGTGGTGDMSGGATGGVQSDSGTYSGGGAGGSNDMNGGATGGTGTTGDMGGGATGGTQSDTGTYGGSASGGTGTSGTTGGATGGSNY